MATRKVERHIYGDKYGLVVMVGREYRYVGISASGGRKKALDRARTIRQELESVEGTWKKAMRQYGQAQR